MISFFSNIFGYVLNGIYLLVQNYGLAIIIFSILVKFLMLPLSIKQQKTLKKNEKIQEQIKILQVKHKGNQEKINQEVMELYKKEKISPFGGCLSIIIQIILLFSMFYLVRSPLTYMKHINQEEIQQQIEETTKQEGENSISKTYPEISLIKYAQKNENENNVFYVNMNFLGLDLSNVPKENYSNVKVYIIPVLYVISSVVSLKINAKTTAKKEIVENKEEKALTKDDDNKEMNQEELTAQMNKNMSLMMPILSVSVALVAPLGLALYWLINNIIMIVERLMLNKFFSKEEEENA